MTSLHEHATQYDPLAPDTFGCPYPVQAGLRHEAPMHWVEKYGHWVAVTHDVCGEIARDTARWSMGGGQQVAKDPPEIRAILEEGIPRVDTLLTADPPAHTKFRSVINKALSARRIAAFEPRVREIAIDLIEAFRADGRVEFVRNFAYPLPVYVIAELLGAPKEDAEDFKRWSDDSVATLSPHLTLEERMRCTRSQLEFWDYLANQLELRRTQPKDDLLTGIVEARSDGGEELTIPEMVSISSQLLGAGHETTTKLLGSAMLLLLPSRDDVEAIRAGQASVETVVEECLRMEAPVQGLFRTAKEDVAVGGVTVRQGERVQLLYASANRDESHFDEPDAFRANRENAHNHMSFGSGVHYCIGAPLARLETKVALQELVARLPGLRLAPGREAGYEPHYFLRGPSELHLEWDV